MLNNPTVIQVEKSLNIDRPDIIKKYQSQNLSFKEIKDALFKFLMQTGIKFASFEKVNLPVEFKSKVDGDSLVLNNTVFYTVTCRLLDIFVDGMAVYIVAIPSNQYELDRRQLAKLIYLKKLHKIVVFDEDDCRKIGINITDSAWLKSLNKNVLKKWTKLLFKKISELGTVVDCKYSLNEINRQIENSVDRTGEGVAKVTVFKRESLTLKYKILKNKLTYLFPKLKIYPDPTLMYLSKIDSNSSEWLEYLFNYVIKDIIGKIDLRKNYYKDFFRLKNGEIDVANKEKICQLISNELIKKFKVDITNLGYGALRIQDKVTFQTTLLVIEASKTENTRGVKLSENLLKKITSESFHVLSLTFSKKSGTLQKIKGYLFALESMKQLKDYKDYRLQIFDSEKMDNYKVNLLD